MTLAPFWKDATVWRAICIGAVGIITLLPFSYIYRYRQSIKRRLDEIEDEFSKGIMVRDTNPSKGPSGRVSFTGRVHVTGPAPRREFRCLELNEEFVKLHQDTWKLMSLGQYLTSLRPSLPGSSDEESANFGKKLPEFLEHELEATIGAVLLKALGRRFGGAILPLLGITDIQSRTAHIAGNIASWWLSHYVLHDHLEQLAADNQLQDAGCLPFNLSEMVAIANLNEKFIPSRMEIKPLELMERGEVGYEPSFGSRYHDGKNAEASVDEEPVPELIPNPFIASRHWDKAINGLEALLSSQDSSKGPDTPNAEAKESTAVYDPEDRSFPEPSVINERLLPDLHLGWGDAQCTHNLICLF
jgi:hypothetical protein